MFSRLSLSSWLAVAYRRSIRLTINPRNLQAILFL